MTGNACSNTPTGRSKIDLRNRIVISVVTLAMFSFEWLMFELLRMPYRPPHDMLTLLGRGEKSDVIILMGIGAAVWIIYVVWFALRFMLTRSEVISLAAFCGALSVAAVLIAKHPTWPVTPFELLWR